MVKVASTVLRRGSGSDVILLSDGGLIGGVSIFFLTSMLWVNGSLKLECKECQNKLELCSLSKKVNTYLGIRGKNSN